MVATSRRLAVIGGHGRQPSVPWPSVLDVRTFGSPGDQGSGELRRLETSLKRGVLDQVFVLTRWNSHSGAVPRRATRATAHAPGTRSPAKACRRRASTRGPAATTRFQGAVSRRAQEPARRAPPRRSSRRPWRQLIASLACRLSRITGWHGVWPPTERTDESTTFLG